MSWCSYLYCLCCVYCLCCAAHSAGMLSPLSTTEACMAGLGWPQHPNPCPQIGFWFTVAVCRSRHSRFLSLASVCLYDTLVVAQRPLST
ncbi:hypothetical protein EDB81DRAFT_798801 [Dactylonectria macrodidyma]|uniref:Secreted protein n=1 Tax=Dactylonectria macrodidyma TaxID=307937 RepID=A0A9P9J2E0_9HYPO|nr:hypothetical protein EDB81DRAFT_798801 [Dactylonectria macrodidyma]